MQRWRNPFSDFTNAAVAAVLTVTILSGAMPGVALASTLKKNEVSAKRTSGQTSAPLTQQERALHALDRLTFGPGPADLQRVQAMGVDQWIDMQLHPEKINDDALQAMLAEMPAMQLNEARLIEKFPPAPMLRNMEKTNAPLPRDPVEHAIYANQIAYIRAQNKQKTAEKNAETTADTATKTSSGKPVITAMDSEAMAEQPQQMTGANAMTSKPKAQAATSEDDLTPADIQSIQAEKARLLALPPAQRFQALLAFAPGEPRRMMQRLKQPEKLLLIEGFTAEQKEVAIALADTNRVVAGEEMQEKLLYDIYSERQLQEVMTDFWLNHFNVYVRKSGLAPWQIATYEREVIRPRALGKFEDLLKAVATSPAMMDYLDNQYSIGPDSKAAQGAAARKANGTAPAKAADRGLNENYARELMELHTLGVNGGYTQKDVNEVAKVFTGWSVEPPRDGGEFVYVDRRHEPGDKQVLGKTIRDNGQQEGYEVLHMLAMSPATAHMLSQKLAVRFVSDTPSPTLVDAMAKSYMSSKGDIRDVLRTMLKSPEFWSREAYRAKVKTPLEYVVSSVRATETDATHPQSLISALNQMGMPLYGMQPPTGYSDMAEAWVNSAALLTRMNFGLALTSNKLPGLHCELPAITGATGAAVHADPALEEAQLERVLLNGVVGEKTHQTVLQEMQKLPAQEQAAQQQAQEQAQEQAQLQAAQDFAAKNVAQTNADADPLDTGLAARKKPGKARAVNLNVSVVGSSEASIAAGLLLGSPDFQRK